MYVDVTTFNKTVRFAAVYMPHAGYPDPDLRLVYERLHQILEDARSKSFACIVGGDFNTQLHVGLRGDLLQQTLHMYQLHVANGDSEPDNSWTFCSSMGIKRRIDYILYTRNMSARHAEASDDLDLGSDHRSVVAKFHRLNFRQSKRRNNHHRVQYDWSPDHIVRYQRSLTNSLARETPTCFADIESCVVTCAQDVERQTVVSEPKLWQKPKLQNLMRLRRGCRDKVERCRLSKEIRTELRREMRQKRNAKLDSVLREFKDFSRLESVWHDPVKSSRSVRAQDPSPHDFAEYLSGIFAADEDNGQHVASRRGFHIPAFTLTELKYALHRLRKGKSADSQGVVLEMLCYAPDDLLIPLLELYNRFLQDGRMDPSWKHTVFTMLAKKGDRSNVQNWRPVASLKMIYKVLSKLVHGRLQPLLDKEQSVEQMGFRPGSGVDHALCVFDSVCAKAIEFDCDVWFASIDLRKAFDQIHHESLFKALQEQGVPTEYIALLRTLYSQQTGSVADSRAFPIRRGVKQGDVISPILFNAGLEHAIRMWKARLIDHGIDIGSTANLTNVRFADDLMIYAKSWRELVIMLESLEADLASVGLSLNAAKTRIFTTAISPEVAYIDVGGEMIQVLGDGETHMYLGRKICGDLRRQSRTELAHRISAAWGKFNKLRFIFVNKHLSIKGRLKLFNAVVTPTALFGLSTLALTARQLEQLDICQRKMFRSIVGWSRDADATWEETMRRMNARVSSALRQHPVPSWSSVHRANQHRFAMNLTAKNAWPLCAATWSPSSQHNFNSVPRRRPGRPPKRWDDELNKFVVSQFPGCSSWSDVAHLPRWPSTRHDFVQFDTASHIN